MLAYGTITTVAGTGIQAFSGDGGPADKAGLNQPFYSVFDRDGNLLFTESGNNTVRRVDHKTKRITTVAGTGKKGYEGEGGPATRAAFNDLVAMAVDTDGSLYLVDRLNSRVRRVDARTGIVTTVAGDGTKAYGGDGGAGTKAQLKEPHDCVFDGKNSGLLIADVSDCRIRRLDVKTGSITTIAGNGTRVRTGDGGPAKEASFAGARALAVDPRDGTIFVCEREGNGIRRIDGKSGVITLYAGTGKKGFDGDGGPALRASFNGPKSLFCDKAGNLFVVDTENHAIRLIDARSGLITTVAGGHRGADGDGGPATLAGLDRPHGVSVGPDGGLYIADSENNRIRRVDAAPSKP